ncbi:hypothetical protein ABFG93_00230 [Pseudalkalibacillus hwajinpoensis]|uniref:hypothetical protein n=1 Tax=Guptibacillus hwajinpoensis TaxID=208199 RepID=UPI00325C3104
MIELDFMAGITAPKSDKNIPTYMTLVELKKLFRFLEHDHSKYAIRNELMFKAACNNWHAPTGNCGFNLAAAGST